MKINRGLLMGLISVKFTMFLTVFILTMILLIRYSLINRNNKGRLMAIGVSILLLIISSTTMYKSEKHKNFTYSAMRVNYDEFLKELDIIYTPGSKLEENEEFKRKSKVLFSRANLLMINSDIIPIADLFIPKDMEKPFRDLIRNINLIGINLLEEDYLIESINIESMTNYLRQIGSILDSPNRSSSYIRKGKRIKMNYDEKEINKIKSLLADMEKVLVEEITKVEKLKDLP